MQNIDGAHLPATGAGCSRSHRALASSPRAPLLEAAGRDDRRDKKNKWNKRKTVQGRHYTIRPKNPMRLDDYLSALDNLARAAIVRSVELGRSIRISSAAEAEAHTRQLDDA